MLPWIKNLKLIAWDLDGTLYPTSPSLNQAIEDQKMAIVAQHLKVSTGEALVRFRKLYQRFGSSTKVLDALGIDGEAFFLKIWQQLSVGEYIQPNPQLVADFAKMIEITHFDQAILTNSNNRGGVEKKLGLVGLPVNFFDTIYTSVDTGFRKPEPKAFLALLNQGQFEPAHVLYLGDREETDIVPAHELGFRTGKVGLNQSGPTVADFIADDAQTVIKQILENYSR